MAGNSARPTRRLSPDPLYEAEDGRRYEAILAAVPRARYDALRVFEEFERHFADKTTRVVSMSEIEKGY